MLGANALLAGARLLSPYRSELPLSTPSPVNPASRHSTARRSIGAAWGMKRVSTHQKSAPSRWCPSATAGSARGTRFLVRRGEAAGRWGAFRGWEVRRADRAASCPQRVTGDPYVDRSVCDWWVVGERATESRDTGSGPSECSLIVALSQVRSSEQLFAKSSSSTRQSCLTSSRVSAPSEREECGRDGSRRGSGCHLWRVHAHGGVPGGTPRLPRPQRLPGRSLDRAAGSPLSLTRGNPHNHP